MITDIYSKHLRRLPEIEANIALMQEKRATKVQLEDFVGLVERTYSTKTSFDAFEAEFRQTDIIVCNNFANKDTEIQSVKQHFDIHKNE